ncbi:DUF502 domain-containing protein [Chloroflexota bacterium]
MTRKIKLPKPKRPSKLRQNFIAGLVVMIPIVATIWIITYLFNLIDGILKPAFKPIFGQEIPGFGFAAIVILVYLLGLLVTNVLGKKIIQLGQSMVDRVPLISQVYNAFRQIMDSLMLSQKGAFKEVVLIEFPRPGMRSVAFVTSKLKDGSGQELLTVYIPTAPNPTSGFIEIVTPDRVIPTNISVEDAMKIVLSAGMVCPPVIDYGPSMQNNAENDDAIYK